MFVESTFTNIQPSTAATCTIHSEAHKTFPLSYPLSATITGAENELKIIDV